MTKKNRIDVGIAIICAVMFAALFVLYAIISVVKTGEIFWQGFAVITLLIAMGIFVGIAGLAFLGFVAKIAEKVDKRRELK